MRLTKVLNRLKKTETNGELVSKQVKRRISRLQEILALRKQWQEKMVQIERMQKWVIETEHILAGHWTDDEVVLTNQLVAEHFDEHLAMLQTQLANEDNLTEIEKKCLEHFIKIS